MAKAHEVHTVGNASGNRALPDRSGQILPVLAEDRRGQRQLRGARASPRSRRRTSPAACASPGCRRSRPLGYPARTAALRATCRAPAHDRPARRQYQTGCARPCTCAPARGGRVEGPRIGTPKQSDRPPRAPRSAGFWRPDPCGDATAGWRRRGGSAAPTWHGCGRRWCARYAPRGRAGSASGEASGSAETRRRRARWRHRGTGRWEQPRTQSRRPQKGPRPGLRSGAEPPVAGSAADRGAGSASPRTGGCRRRSRRQRGRRRSRARSVGGSLHDRPGAYRGCRTYPVRGRNAGRRRSSHLPASLLILIHRLWQLWSAAVAER
jgi:hypothetical protein